MGAGQFGNRDRTNKAQNPNAYEGKILRYNLESDGDAGFAAWVPNTNPYSSTSAVWSIGIRNNQGFAYDTSTGKLYGTSHGPYSDDELNMIKGGMNYGHPLVIGYAADDNYNGSTAGAAKTDNNGVSACPMIVDESTAAAAIVNYQDPVFSAYAQSQATINNIWVNNPGNGGWPSEGWSGLDIYKHTLIPDNDAANQPANILYYRLKLVDRDGTATYSSTITITLADIAGRVSLYPNPARESVKLSVSAAKDGHAQWKIVDNSGRVVMKSSMNLKKGNNNVMIDINKLAGGLYYLTVNGDGIDQKVKLQKL
ncbi:glucose/Sorbosone dehydrogenase [Ostertagia ostertagi]